MKDAVQAFYESVPYKGGVHIRSHPSRIGAIARLYGIDCHAPDGARVLEVGCSSGENLLAIAKDWPGAECTGIDIVASEIECAREQAQGMANVRFECADVRDFDPGERPYDYIICHGVFSWVEDEVKEAILRLCSRALAPDGVAFVSYNTYPGWLHREALRELLLAQPAKSLEERLAGSKAFLQFFAAALESRTDPYGSYLRREIAYSQRKAIFAHDELGPVNDPCYFLQFVEWAEEFGLRWVSDSPANHSMTPEYLPEKARTLLKRLSVDRLRFEQISDLLTNRAFRASILCREGRMKTPTGSQLQGLQFQTSLKPQMAPGDLTSREPVVFASGTQRLTVVDPVIKSVIHALQTGVQPFEQLNDGGAWENEVIVAGFLRDLLVRGVAEAVLAGRRR